MAEKSIHRKDISWKCKKYRKVGDVLCLEGDKRLQQKVFHRGWKPLIICNRKESMVGKREMNRLAGLEQATEKTFYFTLPLKQSFDLHEQNSYHCLPEM